MDRFLTAITKKYGKPSVPTIKPGQTIRVHQKIVDGGKERISIFEGVVIAVKHGRGLSGSFTVRRVASGVGVERVFPLHLPSIVKIETKKISPVRRAKLYYVRRLSGRALKRKDEQRLSELWEDLAARAELEQIEAEKAAEAKAKEEARAEEEADAEAKVEAAKASHVPAADEA